MPSLLRRGNCAPHSDSSGAELFDSNGNPCATLTQEDKIIIGAVSGVCGLTLLILGYIYLRRLRRLHRQEQTLQSDSLMSNAALDAPLIFRVSSASASINEKGRGPAWAQRPLSPVSPSTPYSPYLSSPSSSGSEDSHGGDRSRLQAGGSPQFTLGSGSGSSSDHSHLPILSADGHLLPVSPPLQQGYQAPGYHSPNQGQDGWTYPEEYKAISSGKSEDSHYSKRSLPPVPQVAQIQIQQGYLPQPSRGVVGVYPEEQGEQDIGYGNGYGGDGFGYEGINGLYGYPQAREHGYAPVSGFFGR